MNLIEVPVPKHVRHMVSKVSAFAFQIGKRGDKIPVRLFGDDLGRFRGKKVICEATKTHAPNSDGKIIELFSLKPTNKAKATHTIVRINGEMRTVEL